MKYQAEMDIAAEKSNIPNVIKVFEANSKTINNILDKTMYSNSIFGKIIENNDIKDNIVTCYYTIIKKKP